MSRRRYDGGALVEEWDDNTATYSRRVAGEVVEARAYTPTEVALQESAATQAARVEWERSALAANESDIARDTAARADALDIANNPATTLTAAQTVAALKRLAQAVATLAENDARTKRQLNALIRRAAGA